MMKCYEIMEKLEVHSPVTYAEDWDNVGLLAGRPDKEIKSIYTVSYTHLTLPTMAVV